MTLAPHILNCANERLMTINSTKENIEIDGSGRFRCRECGCEVFLDTRTILGVAVLGCPECDAMEHSLTR